MPPEMESELDAVVRILAQNRWPWRLHATYDETISRALDVFEHVNRDIPLKGLNWFFDHAETISDRSIDRIAALGGGIAVQHRMAYQGEYFVERYGVAAAEATPPVKRILESGVKTSAGTDATRVASYNPWVSLAWLVTGRTVGGMHLYPQRNCLDRETALRMWTENVTWFSNEESRKGRIEVGRLADLIVPDRDYFSCPEDQIADTVSLLTVVGGRIVYASGDYARFDDVPAPAMPDWSPVSTFGGYGAKDRGGKSYSIAGSRLRPCPPLQCPQSSACDSLVEQPTDSGSQELLGSTRMFLLGGVSRNSTILGARVSAAVVAALLGVAFFFAIVGVFGLPVSIAALLLFVALSLLVFRRPQSE
jgi:hypothetical protein